MPQAKRFLLRLDPRLFEALRRWADDDLRSINAQIEYLLTDAARRAGRLPRQTTRRPPEPTGEEPPEAESPGADASEISLDSDEISPAETRR
jgi:hypothetical protein